MFLKILSGNRLLILLNLCIKDFNITELQGMIRIKYKSTYEHVKKLEKYKLVTLRSGKGREVIVSLNKKETLSYIKIVDQYLETLRSALTLK